MNPSLNKDIHLLPAEIISDILNLTAAASTPEFWSHPGGPAPELRTELERLENAPLLLLSRVCSRWHDIALKTPLLWSNIQIHGMTEAALEESVWLLTERLDRSGSAPLAISLQCEHDSQSPHPRFLHLLAEHSHRWETVCMSRCCIRGFDTSILRGNVPHLKILWLDVETRFGLSDPDAPIDFFAVAPHLERLWLAAPLVNSDSVRQILHRKQLKSFGCVAMFPQEFRDGLSLLPQLPPGAHAHIALDLDHRILKLHHISPFHLPPLSTCISSLVCRTTQLFHAADVSSALTQIFTSLTLSALQQMSLGCNDYPHIALDWSTALRVQFIALCRRSALGRCLTTLRVVEVHITERDLLKILSVLTALEHLEVGDAPPTVKHSLLITDSFVRAMAGTALGNCFVPRLSRFVCVTRFMFRQKLLVDFVESRLTRLAALDNPTAFHLHIHAFPDSKCGLDPRVHAILSELAKTESLFFYESLEAHRYTLVG
ncbi:hypothetical protein FB45DRAFT_1062922 [Roridomyces roridus]|uniref:F-box domain-containing protein n=1 Tax=Roridomyces roridus TaxID=1738132 RepID=A0AAD7BFP6_9AGAR|nr:hypothetical protein FB45DRAFT_1062922 [Roridomyces roridus]